MSSIERLAGLSPDKREWLFQRLREHSRRESSSSSIVAPLMGQPSEFVPDAMSRYAPFPLTEVQQAYWVGRRSDFELGSIGSHGYMEVESCDLDLENFERAWRKVIGRHEMLRVVVRPNGEQQILREVPPYHIRVENLCILDQEEKDRALARIREQMSHEIFDPEIWPLFQIRASRIDERKIRIHISIDMMIVDAWSLDILSDDLQYFYRQPHLALPPLTVSYRDYTLAECRLKQNGAASQSKVYWEERLRTLPPAPDLPTARHPREISKPRFVRRTLRLGRTDWQALRTHCSHRRITPAGVFLTAYMDVLQRWARQAEHTINLTWFNRRSIHPEVGQVVGDFTSLLLVPSTRGTRDGTFAERAQHVQRTLWEAIDHAAGSGTWLMRELARQRGNPTEAVMPVIFTCTLSRTADPPRRIPFSWLGEVNFALTQTPQVWLDHQVEEHDGELVCDWDAVEDLFPQGMLDDMFMVYRQHLLILSTDPAAWDTTLLVPLPEWQQKMLAHTNATEAPVREGLLHTPFLKQGEEEPGRLAVVSGETRLTYGEVLQKSRRVCAALQAKGIQPNDLVAVIIEKGWRQVIAVLGVLQAGGAYVPIDPRLPPERIRYLLTHTEARMALMEPARELPSDCPASVEPLVVDDLLDDREESQEDRVRVIADDLAYVIFTSGSTGLPKGVMIDHQGALNTVTDVNKRFSVTATDRVLAISSLNFDLSVYDIFGILAAGGVLVMPSPCAHPNPEEWAGLVKKEGITIWNSVPAIVDLLVTYLENRGECLPESLRLILMSGDWIPVTLPDRIRRLSTGSDIEIISLGGATEASIWSILYKIEDIPTHWRSIPYGKAMDNQTVQVLNHTLEVCPVWVPGQLYIGGMGVANGYWRDPEKTKKHFVVHPRTGERLYWTGDLGRYLPDGNIEFLGREDCQVKIQGFRIELGEIESVLAAHPNVQTAVVDVQGDDLHERHLVGYVVPRRQLSDATDSELEGAPLKVCEDGENGRGISESPAAVEIAGVLTEDLARLEFKLRRKGLRHFTQQSVVTLSKFLNKEELKVACLQRRSCRKYSSRIMTLEMLSNFMLPLASAEHEGLHKYRYASAGGLYPVQVYLYVHEGKVAGLPGGMYYYDPSIHALVTLWAGRTVDPEVYDSSNQAIFIQAAFAMYFVADLRAIEPMYGPYSREFCFLEAGAMCQLIESNAPSVGVGVCQTGMVDFSKIQEGFALENGHMYLHSLLGGELPEECLGMLRKGLEVDGETRGEIALTEEVLKDYLAEKLPHYMVPSKIILLEALPLSPNGKIDRKALSKVEDHKVPCLEKRQVPNGDLESIIAAVWCDVLQKDRIAMTEGFFDLGGTSMQMIQVHGRLNKLLGRDIPIIDMFFRYPSIKSLAAHLSASDEIAVSGQVVSGRQREQKQRAKLREKRMNHRRQEPT